MLNSNKVKNKNNFVNNKNIIIFFSLIVIITLTTVFVFNNRTGNNDNIKKNVGTRNKNSKKIPSNKRKSQVIKKNAQILQGGEVAPWNIKRTDGKKMAYLTFDDGPSINTTGILQVLDKNNIKANFFILGPCAEKYPDLVKKEWDDGEIIGNHTYSHQLNYKEGPVNFVKDLDKCEGILKSILGDKYTSKLVRFPGGASDPRGQKGKLAAFREAVTKAGYRYLDWNDETADAEEPNVSDPSVPYLLENLKKYTAGSNVVVVLMHDAGAKKNTVLALQQVIDYLKSQGFSFDVIK